MSENMKENKFILVFTLAVFLTLILLPITFAIDNSTEINEIEQDTTNDEIISTDNEDKNIILENGYNYEVKVGIEYSQFPTKQYSSVVLPAGEYKALRIIIGEGKGKNWWCVMFPPLCFVDGTKEVMDSKEIVDSLENNNEKEIDNKIKFRFKLFEILFKK